MKNKFIIFSLLVGKLYAEDTKYQFINISLGGNYGYSLDKAYSPNIYNKAGGNFSLGYKNGNNNRIIEVSFDINTQFIGDEFIPMYSEKFAQIYFGEIAVSYLFFVSEFNLFGKYNKIYIGPEIYNYGSMVEIESYSNNSINYSYFLDISPKLEMDFNFEILDKPFLINYSLSLPIFAFGLRPGYSNPYNPTYGTYFLGEYMRINTEIFLEFKIRELNKFSVGYRWQYLQNEGINKTQFIDAYLIFKFSYAI